MFSKFSKYIIDYSAYVLVLIISITSFAFYRAFLSEDKLAVDFSLEQMFPDNDPDRDVYEKFKKDYGREDNVAFKTLTNDNIFSDENLSILEMINYSMLNLDSMQVSHSSSEKKKPIEFVVSLGTLWDDGEGKIGDNLNPEERLEEVKLNDLYSDLLSDDNKSSLIVYSIHKDIYNHDMRKYALQQVDSIIASFKFDLVYDGKAFLIDEPELKNYKNSFQSKPNEKLFIFSNNNVLSNISVGPYSALQAITDSLSNSDIKINSINDCYYSVNESTEEDIPIDLSMIKENCPGADIFISEDLKYTTIKLELLNGDEEYEKIITKIKQNPYIRYSDWEWHDAGLPILRTGYVDLVEEERMLFIPLAFLIAALTLIWVFRQFKSLIIALISIVISIIWVSGFMSLFNISINVISYLTFNLLMVIGVSDAIHLLMKYHEEIHNYKDDKKKALNSVIQKIGSALFLTSFTTAVGFVSLTITNVKILQEFGIIMGVGIGILFTVTITVMPIMLYYIKTPHKKHIDRLILKKESSLSFWLSETVKRHPKKIITISALVLCISIYGMMRIDSDVTILGDLKPGNKLYEDIHFVENNFGGTLPLEIIITTDSQSKNSIINNSQFYEKIVNFSNYLIKNEHIKTVNSYWDLEGNNHNNQSRYTNSDRSEIRISCGITNIDSNQMDILKNEIRDKYSDLDLENDINMTGSTLLALKMNKYLVTSLLSSFLLAFLVIFVSMNILFKSIKLSLAAILPNVIPLLFAGGIMGFAGIELRPSTAMTFSIALGIAVDDTIHFLSRFRSEYSKSKQHQSATDLTILTTGRAIISTTITLGMGFIVLVFSNFKPNFEFGILASIILLVALLSSLLLLPALINLTKPLKESK